jgi:guanine deaminase
LTAVQHASIAAKVIAMRSTPVDTNQPGFSGRQLSVATLLHLATLGGAQVCDLEGQIGSLAPGKAFDALIVDIREECGNPGIWVNGWELSMTEENVGKMLERFLFCGDDRNIRKVYVQGRCVGGSFKGS